MRFWTLRLTPSIAPKTSTFRARERGEPPIFEQSVKAIPRTGERGSFSQPMLGVSLLALARVAQPDVAWAEVGHPPSQSHVPPRRVRRGQSVRGPRGRVRLGNAARGRVKLGRARSPVACRPAPTPAWTSGRGQSVCVRFHPPETRLAQSRLTRPWPQM